MLFKFPAFFMYKTSTYFVKQQIPNTSVADLLELYRQELKDQMVSKIEINGNQLSFSNDIFKVPANRYANDFSGFRSGKIIIEDSGTEYLVRFKADISRTFAVAGIISALITLISLIRSPFDSSLLFTGLIYFVLISVVGYGIALIS